MATDLDVLRVRIDADISQLKSAMREAGAVVTTQTRKMDRRFSLGFNRMAGRARFWAAAVVGAGAVFTATAISMAADAEEVEQLFKEVFKNSSANVEAWAQSFADATGRSVFDLKIFASNFQDTFVPMGFARDQAAELSIAMSRLAIDIGSFKNVRADEAANLLQSALVGNHRAVRRFGIVITEARLQAELFRMGIKTLAADVDTLTKVQARLNIIYADSADSQGDLIRTSQSTQNRMRAVEASTKDASIAFGQLFTSAVAEGSGSLITFLDVIEKVINRLSSIEFRTIDVLREGLPRLLQELKVAEADVAKGEGGFLTQRIFGTEEERAEVVRRLKKDIAFVKKEIKEADFQSVVQGGDPGFIPGPNKVAIQIDKNVEKAKLLTAETIKMTRALADGSMTADEADASLRAYASALASATGEQVVQNDALFEARRKTEDAKNAYKALKEAFGDTTTEAEGFREQIAFLVNLQKKMPEQSDLIAKAITRLSIELVNANPILRERNRLLVLQAELNGTVASSAAGLAELQARGDARDIGIDKEKLSGKKLEDFVQTMTPVLVAQDQMIRKQKLVRQAVEASIEPQQTYTENLASLNELLAAGSLTNEQYEVGVIKIKEEYIAQDKVLSAIANTTDQYFDSIIDGTLRGSIAMEDFGKLTIKVLQDITKAIIQAATAGKSSSIGSLIGQLIIGALSSGAVSGAGPQFTGTGVEGLKSSGSFAKGGAILPRAAAGMIVQRPTDIRVAETSGAEGIFPLAKTAGGELGIRAVGSGGDSRNVTYNIDARGSDPGVVSRIVRAIKQLDQGLERRAVVAVRSAKARSGGRL